jgi:putative tricarboxylic transport membrane protein
MAPPGLDDAQKAALIATMDATVQSEGWKKVLADRSWLDLYLSGDAFAKFIADENARITETLTQIGLVQ